MKTKKNLINSSISRSAIYGAIFGFILSLLYLVFYFIVFSLRTNIVAGTLYNSIGTLIFALPGSLVVLGAYKLSILSYLLFFVINILFYGIIGVILSIFLKEANKKVIFGMLIVFVIFFASSFLYFSTLMQTGRGGPTSLKPVADPKEECLKEGAKWALCDDIKNGPGTCKTIAKVNKAYEKYPDEGCDCGSDKYWAASYNTCWKKDSAKKIDQLTLMEIGIALNLIILAVVSFGIRFFKNKK